MDMHDERSIKERSLFALPVPAAIATNGQSSFVMRRHLGLLLEEQLCAQEEGLGNDRAYMDDLGRELVEARYTFTVAVLRDVAILRAALGERPEG
jgi:hypothetical protein